jgi:hypothetical protein
MQSQIESVWLAFQRQCGTVSQRRPEGKSIDPPAFNTAVAVVRPDRHVDQRSAAAASCAPARTHIAAIPTRLRATQSWRMSTL